MNLISNLINGLVTTLCSNQSTKELDICIDIENQLEKTIFVNDESNEHDSNNLIIGSGYDGYNSMLWQRPTSSSDYLVFYKGTKYVVSYLDIIKIIDNSNNKSYPIEFILKIYIENNFNINLSIIQLVV